MSGQKWKGSDPALGLLLDTHGETYVFTSAEQLMVDFWQAVNSYLESKRF